MPKGSKVARCVRKVRAKKSARNPYAVCQAATGQSYRTGRRRSRSARRGG